MKKVENIWAELSAKIELSEEKVELGAIDDLKKKLDKNISNFDSSVSKVRNIANDFVDLEGDFSKISSEASVIQKQLSDLGIDDPKNLGFIALKAKELENLSRQFIKTLR